MGQLLFKKCFFDAIRAGEKRTTIRRWTRARLNPGQRAFAPGLGWLLIESVEVVQLSRLSAADARADGFSSLAALRKTLRELYPRARGNQDQRAWFRIRFKCSPSPTTPPPRRGKAQRRPGPINSRSSNATSSTSADAHRRALADILRIHRDAKLA